MAFTSPPPAPQRGDRSTFSQRMDAFLVWLVNLIPQLNLFLSTITTLAAGGANSFAFIFDTATDDVDPGTGKLRLGSAAQSGSVVMRLDNQAGSGGDITAFLTALQAGTSNVKGSVRLQKVGDTSSWLLFDITTISVANGYRNLTITPRASSSINPFTKDDTVVAFFDMKGDKGDGGNTPTQAEMRAAIGVLPIENGGTGATTVDQARANIGAKASGTEPVATGGTGATSAAQALTNLGAYPRAGGPLTGAVTPIAGSQGAPAINWGNATGLYLDGDGNLVAVVAGVISAKFTQTGVQSPKLTQTQ